MDYGAPVGFRLAAKHPQRVDALIVQNGNAYEEGLLEFWKPIKAYWNHKTPENVEFHLLDTGHFALEEDGDVIARHMRNFLATHVGGGRRTVTAK